MQFVKKNKMNINKYKDGRWFNFDENISFKIRYMGSHNNAMFKNIEDFWDYIIEDYYDCRFVTQNVCNLKLKLGMVHIEYYADFCYFVSHYEINWSDHHEKLWDQGFNKIK